MSFDAGSVLGHISLDSSGYEAGAKKVSEHSKSMFEEMFKAQLGFELFKKSIELAIDVLKESLKAFEAHEVVVTKLNAVLASTKGVAGMTKQSILELSDSLSKSTKFSQDQVIAADDVLLRFTTIGKTVFPEATQAILDMATARTMDTEAAAQMTGRLLSNANAMSMAAKFGITFTEQQKELGKQLMASGKTVEYQQMVLKALETQFGGSAAAMRDTFGGAVQAAKNRWEEFQITLGSYESKVGKPIVESFISMTDSMNAFLSSAKGMQEVEDIASGVAQTFAIIKIIAGSLLDVVGKDLKSIMDTAGASLATIADKGKGTATVFTVLNGVVYALEIGFTIVTKIINLLITQIGDLINAGIKSADFLGKLGDALAHMGDKAKWDAVAKAGGDALTAFVDTGKDLVKDAQGIVTGTYDMFTKADTTISKMTDNMIKESQRAASGIHAAFANGSGRDMGGAVGGNGNPYSGKAVSKEARAAGALQGEVKGAGEHGGEHTGQALGEQTGAEAQQVLQDQFSAVDQTYSKYGTMVADVVSKMQNTWDQYYQNQLTMVDNDRQAKEAALDADYASKTDANNKSTLSDKAKADKQTAIDKEYADKKAKIEKEAKDKSAALKKQQFEADKAASIIQATVATAQAVAGALANSGNPYLGIVMAAIMGALGAVQIALIAAQPTPTFAMGGVANPGWAKVGERGPELIHIGETSRIYSNAESMQIGGGKEINQNNHYYGDLTGNADLDRHSESQARILRGLLRQG
jgi:hypothetical protein